MPPKATAPGGGVRKLRRSVWSAVKRCSELFCGVSSLSCSRRRARRRLTCGQQVRVHVCVCACVCVCVCVYLCMSVCMHVLMYVYALTDRQIHGYTYMSKFMGFYLINTHVCIYIWYILMYVYPCICLSVSPSKRLHTHTHTPTHTRSRRARLANDLECACVQGAAVLGATQEQEGIGHCLLPHNKKIK